MPRRAPKEATPAYLERVALWYLERYPGSTARVRAALEKRVRRSVQELGTDPADGAEAVARVLEKLQRLGLLDDARFAASRVRALRARGKSARAIRATLARQGLDGDTIDAAFEAEGGDELEAARRFAQKRRLGAWRRPGAAADDKELAKLARAGFSLDVARRVLDEPPEE